MYVKDFTIELNTEKNFQIIDITQRVLKFLKKSKITEGHLLVFSKHTTLAITINENENNLLKDLELFLEKILPYSHNYLHQDNAASHLRQILLGTHQIIPIKGNELLLGIWQRIFAVEFDGPRKREVFVQITGK